MNASFIFFGTPDFSVIILDELKAQGLLPSLVVTAPDAPRGRGLVLTPPPVKVWAEKHSIPVIQPETLKNGSVDEVLKNTQPEFFVVASYGKIIPQHILDIAPRGALNVHPSLLPKLRGSSPIQGAILSEEKTGVSIMKLDAEMDHGPILAQKEILTSEWPPYAPELEVLLAHAGGVLLADTIPHWLAGEIRETPQDHSQATFTKKVNKEDARINLSESPELNLKKIRAYAGAPDAFTFWETKDGEIRVKIRRARLENGELVIERVVPEGRSEMSFEEFKNGIAGR